MICYKDKTFCPFHEECRYGIICADALTEAVLRAAKEWWGNASGDPPISKYIVRPACFMKKDKETIKHFTGKEEQIGAITD